MEIQSTFKELPEKIRHLDLSPEASVRVVISEIKIARQKHKRALYLPFLDGELWDGEDTPTDLSANVDYYLYDLDDPHGK